MASKNRAHQRIVFHDYETENLDSKVKQGAAKPVEYAAVEVDENLNELPDGRHHKIISPSSDVIGNPYAYLVHGIDTDMARKVGMSEFEFIEWLGQLYQKGPNTVISGFNTMNFDDEVTRHSRFRNLLPAYKPEFENGNFRFDIFKVVQLAYAMAPDILEWAKKADGSDSLKLTDLTAANGIDHLDAHSALSDVDATISLAKLIKERKPDLWHYALWLTDKKNINSMLREDGILLSTNTVYGQASKYTKAIYPLIIDPKNPNKMLCVDMNSPDLSMLFEHSPEKLNKLLFTSKLDLGADAMDVPLLDVTANKMPLAIPATNRVLEAKQDAFKLDIDIINKNMEKIRGNQEQLKKIVQETYTSDMGPGPSSSAHKLYFLPGFPTPQTSRLMSEQHREGDDGKVKLKTANIAALAAKTDTPDLYYDLALQAKFRTWMSECFSDPTTSPAEIVDFADYLVEKLEKGIDETYTFDQFDTDMLAISKERVLSPKEKKVLEALSGRTDDQRAMVENLKIMSEELRPAAEKEKKNSQHYRLIKGGPRNPVGPGM
jgi:exodeoxyribonuclease-1